MDESESKNEKPKEECRFDPELLKKGLRCDRWQCKFLKLCSEKSEKGEDGIKRWSEWRTKHPNKEIWLQGANLSDAFLRRAYLAHAHLEEATLWYAHLERGHFADAHLEGADLRWTHLEEAIFVKAYLQKAKLTDAHLEEADLSSAHLEGAKLQGASVKSAHFMGAIVDGNTNMWKVRVNQLTRSTVKDWLFTDFSGVPLQSVIIDPATKQLIEYNIRRKYWYKWINQKDWGEIVTSGNIERNVFSKIVRSLVHLFFWISDYGLRTWRVIATFFGLAIAFAVVYWLCPTFVMVNQVVGDIRGFWHALYFSVVTMTTLGFGDIAANPDSWSGQTLLMIQVILGYVLLGALVTRFAVLFTAGGPAGTFSKEKKK